MRNEAGDIVQDHPEDSAQEWKTRARAAWDATRATYQQLQDKTVEYSKATDQAIREKPYVAIGVAFGVGMLIGFLATRGKVEEEEE